ncbi:MAG: hypothetical protein WCP53_13350, partial [Verrucomicrobiota bacterium]
MPEEVGASDAEAEHGLCVGFERFTQESVVAEVGSYFRLVEVPCEEQMGPRGSADPTHEGRDGLPPV